MVAVAANKYKTETIGTVRQRMNENHRSIDSSVVTRILKRINLDRHGRSTINKQQ